MNVKKFSTGDNIFDDGLTQNNGIDCFQSQQSISHFLCLTALETSQGETATQASLIGTLHMYV